MEAKKVTASVSEYANTPSFIKKNVWAETENKNTRPEGSYAN